MKSNTLNMIHPFYLQLLVVFVTFSVLSQTTSFLQEGQSPTARGTANVIATYWFKTDYPNTADPI